MNPLVDPTESLILHYIIVYNLQKEYMDVSKLFYAFDQPAVLRMAEMGTPLCHAADVEAVCILCAPYC